VVATLPLRLGGKGAFRGGTCPGFLWDFLPSSIEGFAICAKSKEDCMQFNTKVVAYFFITGFLIYFFVVSIFLVYLFLTVFFLSNNGRNI
jgi:hypothetical protein